MIILDYKYKVFTPYRLCLLGSHIDHQLGNIIGCTINKGITLYYNCSKNIEIYSEHFNETFKLDYINYIDLDNINTYGWGKYLLGAVYVLRKYYNIENYISGYIKSDLNIGGLSSSSAVIINYLKALCFVNNIDIVNNNLLLLAYEVEHTILKINIGKMDQINQIFYKHNNFLYYDGLNEKIKYKKSDNKLHFLIVFCGKERELLNTQYNDKVSECKKLAKLLSNNKYSKLRFIDKNKFTIPINNESLYKKGIHFSKEMGYVQVGWDNINDINVLGDLINLSCLNSINNYENGSEELITLYHICKNILGVYGCKFCGGGFNGNLFALIDDKYTDTIINTITNEYLKIYPCYKDKFNIVSCDMN